MNPLAKVLRGRPAAVGGTALSRSRGPAMDLDWPNPNCWSSFFTDLMHQTGGFLSPPGSAVNSDGWPTGVSATQTITFFIWTGLNYSSAACFRPGVYKARMDTAHASAGWTCQFVDQRSSGITSISAAGSTCTVTVTDLGVDGDYSGLTLNLLVTAPPTGGPYNLTGLQIYKQAHEAWLDNGTYSSIFDPDFLADMVGVRSIRVKDWLGTDISSLNDIVDGTNIYRTKMGPCSAADLPAESFRTWQMPSSAQFVNVGSTRLNWGGSVPYSVCAKLARYLNCTLMMSFPLMHDRASFDAFASGSVFQCYGHDFHNGDVVVLGYNFIPATFTRWTPYYVRDVVPGVSWKLSDTPGGAVHTVAADSFLSDTFQQNAYRLYSESDTQTFYNAIAAEMFAAAPGIDIISDVGNENWNIPQPYGQDQCFSCLTAQTPNRNPASGYAWAQMRAWKAIETYYPRAQHIRMYSGQQVFFGNIGPTGYSYTDATLFSGETIANLIDAHCNAPYITSSFNPGLNNAGLDALNAAFQVNTMPVAGSDWYAAEAYVPGDVVHMIDGKNYSCIANNTNQQPPNATYWVLASTDTLVGSGLTWNNDQMLAFGLRSNSQIAAYSALYRSQADALRTNPVRAGYVNYEGGPNWGNCPSGGSGGSSVFTQQMAAFMKSAQFLTLMQDYVNTVLVGTGITTPHYYVGAGEWRWVNNTNAVVYGLKRAHHLPDTPASAYYKSAVI